MIFPIRNRSLIIRVEIEKGLMMSAEKKNDFRGVECLEERLQRLFLRNKLKCTNDSCTTRLGKSIRKTNRVNFDSMLTLSPELWKSKLWAIKFSSGSFRSKKVPSVPTDFEKTGIFTNTHWEYTMKKDVTETQRCPFPQTSLSLPLFAVPWCTKNPLFLSRVSQRNGIEALLWSSVRQRGFPPPGKSADQMRTVTH